MTTQRYALIAGVLGFLMLLTVAQQVGERLQRAVAQKAAAALGDTP